MNADLEPRKTAIEKDPKGFWWVYSNGQKIARTSSEESAKRLAREFKDNGYFEGDCYE